MVVHDARHTPTLARPLRENSDDGNARGAEARRRAASAHLEERDPWDEDWSRGRARYEERRLARRSSATAGLSRAWGGDASATAISRPTETAFRAGDHVRHAAFGEGVVVTSRLSGDDEQVTVAFPDKGVKKLMASFAQLEKV